MRHLDTDALAAFVAVVDAGGFTSAAERLGRTQAAVSTAIARFEERLGRRLLDRSRRGVRLTDGGELLISYARRILAVEDEAIAALHADKLDGHIRVGMPDDYLEAFARPLLEQFSRDNRNVNLEIQCCFSHELEGLVENGDIDLAIITREPGRPLGEFLRREDLVWCAAADRRPEREDPLPLALFPDGCRARPQILGALDAAGRRWRIAWTSSHLPSIETAVSLGVAVTALPRSVVPVGFRQLGAEDGLPALKPLELAILAPQGARAVVRRIAGFCRHAFGAAAAELQS